MCKPPCCNPKKGSDGGALAVVLIVAAVVLAAKIAPAVIEAGRILATVLEITLLAAGSAAALAVLVWAGLRIRRISHCRRWRPVIARQPEQRPMFVPVSEQACLACGEKGQVIRLFGDGSVLARPCPECQPDRIVR